MLLTIFAVAVALGLGISRPLGIALAGGAALLDFVLIRRLAAAALIRRPQLSSLVPMALAKSLVLILVPAAALLLPSALIDGVSFATGASALPLAVVLDAMLPLPAGHA